MSSSFAPGENETTPKRILQKEDPTPDTQCDAVTGKKVAHPSRLLRLPASFKAGTPPQDLAVIARRHVSGVENSCLSLCKLNG